MMFYLKSRKQSYVRKDYTIKRGKKNPHRFYLEEFLMNNTPPLSNASHCVLREWREIVLEMKHSGHSGGMSVEPFQEFS